MKNIIIIVFIFMGNLYANISSRRNKIINLINEELREITRVVKQTKGRKPTLMLRMSELYFEKARLQEENENFNLLKIPVN